MEWIVNEVTDPGGTLTYAGQEVSVTSTSVSVYNERQKVLGETF